jgi:diguanylate cyclase
MPTAVDRILRTPESYNLAAQALAEMRRCQVWPTPLNFELWIKAVAEPEGRLAQVIAACLAQGEAITEHKSEELAAVYLDRNKLGDALEATGRELAKQVDAVSRAAADAQRHTAAYGQTLAGAALGLEKDAAPVAVAELVKTLTDATRLVQQQNSDLERRLSDSTLQVRRLQQNLDIVRRDSITDALTNLANRKAWDEGIEAAVAHCEKSRGRLCVAILDIDHFKRFNDTWGHQTGDQVIRYVASVLQRLGAAPRIAARYGGEEFAIALPGERACDVTPILEAIREEISSKCLKRRSTNEELGAVTISIGLAEFRRGESANELVRRADAALYASKRDGRNCLTLADDVTAQAVA